VFVLGHLLDRASLSLVYKRSVYTRALLPDILEAMKRESQKGLRIIDTAFIVLSIVVLPSRLINPVLSAVRMGDTLEKSADSLAVVLPAVVPVAGLLALSYICSLRNANIRCYILRVRHSVSGVSRVEICACDGAWAHIQYAGGTLP
jgi:hypothetical protein